MAERKFQVIREQQVGHLPKRLQARWRAMARLQERIQTAQAKLEGLTAQLAEEAEPYLEKGEKGAYRGLRMGEDGALYQVYCECPACQADLHHMSVTEVVEEMIRQELIEPEQADDVRAKAVEIDASKRARVKRARLMN